MKHRPSSWRSIGLASLVVALAGEGGLSCTAPTSAVAGAAVSTAVAVGVAGYERSQGRCVAACPPGTACIPSTGLCEPLPCRGRCAATERCVMRGILETCVPGSEVDLRIETPGGPTAPQKPLEPAPAAPAEPERVTPR